MFKWFSNPAKDIEDLVARVESIESKFMQLQTMATQLSGGTLTPESELAMIKSAIIALGG